MPQLTLHQKTLRLAFYQEQSPTTRKIPAGAVRRMKMKVEVRVRRLNPMRVMMRRRVERVKKIAMRIVTTMMTTSISMF